MCAISKWHQRKGKIYHNQHHLTKDYIYVKPVRFCPSAYHSCCKLRIMIPYDVIRWWICLRKRTLKPTQYDVGAVRMCQVTIWHFCHICLFPFIHFALMQYTNETNSFPWKHKCFGCWMELWPQQHIQR